MWPQWPVRTKKVPFVRAPRSCNFSNLRVIETNGSTENSFQGASLADSPGYSMEQTPSQMRPKLCNLVPIQPAKSNASFKVKQKYFNKSPKRRNRRPRSRRRDNFTDGHVSKNPESAGRSFQKLPVQSQNVHLPTAKVDKPSQRPKPSNQKYFQKPPAHSQCVSLPLAKADKPSHPHKPSNQPLKGKKESDKCSSKKITEAPDKMETLDNEDCFEEVEVASYETEGQEVPVSFRKTKVRYLKYKKQCFFKPKIYNIAKDCITVSCLSAAKDVIEDASATRRKPRVTDDQKLKFVDEVDEDSDRTEPADDVDEADIMQFEDEDVIIEENSKKEISEDIKNTTIDNAEKKLAQVKTKEKAQEVSAEKKSSQVTAETKSPQVTAEKKSPQVTAEKKSTQVKVEKKSPQVKVEKKSPQVKVEKKSPQVKVEKKSPQVKVEKKSPQGCAENKSPQVSEEKNSPQISAEKKSPQVSAEKKPPQVRAEKKSPQAKAEKILPQVNAVKKSPQVSAVKKSPQVSAVKKSPQVAALNRAPKVTVEMERSVDNADKKLKPVASVNEASEIEEIEISGKSNKANQDHTNVKQSPRAPGKVIEVIDLEDDDEDIKAKEQIAVVSVLKPKESRKITPRVYKKFADSTLSIYQGNSVVQMSLDSWKSHLIGMEYLIEVQDKVKNEILSHHCVLCSEDLPFGKFKSIVILNHINSYDHIVKYMEKLFPTYSFRENKGFDNIVTLQKVCEEINETFGYYSMCITTLDQFVPCKDALRKALLNLEKSYKKSEMVHAAFVKNTFEKVFEDEIGAVVKSIFYRISQKQLAFQEKKRLKSFLRAKKGTPVSSFLKLKLATSDFRKPSKSMKPELIFDFKASKGTAAKSTEPKSASSQEKNLPKETADAKTEEDDSNDIIILPSPPAEAPPKEETVLAAVVPKESPKSKEKISVKPTLHSKHCPKRSQFKGNSRSTGKAGLQTELAKDAASKIVPKPKHVVKTANTSVFSDSENKNFKQRGFKVNSDKDFTSLHNVTVRKVKDPNQASDMYRKINIKFKKGQDLKTVGDLPRKVSDRSASPSKERSSSPYKRIVRRVSKSPARRVITSPLKISPTRCIKSPLRMSPTRGIKSPLRISPTRCIKSPLSISPARRITSPLRVSPLRRHSRSPGRRIRRPLSPVNKFPRKQSRSPVRKRSKSPGRRHSRSPVRRRSRSPNRRNSRSPVKRNSRSPVRRNSRSPVRRRSRSPARRRSRSPVRRHSRSPNRRQNRSPARGYARSTARRNSRSPRRKFSRSPQRRRSRSYERKRSRSPISRRSRSPLRLSRSPKRLRSPHRRISGSSPNRQSSTSSKYKNTFHALSPSFEPRIHESSRDSFGKYSSSRSPQRSLGKHSSRYDSVKHKQSSRSRSPNSVSEKFIPFLNSLSNPEIDLDPVSDEDESKYFGNLDEVPGSEKKIASAPKKFVAELLKKFSMADNPNDTTVNKFMQFMQAHSSEIQELMGSQSSAKSDKIQPPDVPSAIQEQTSFLQQCLFQNLGIKKEQLPSHFPFAPRMSSAAASFAQQAFLANQLSAKFGQALMIPGLDRIDPSLSQGKMFPPNLNVPPPNQFTSMSQKPANPIMPPKPRVPSEVMFKDLKAKVSKLFGPNATQRMPESNPGFVAEQDPVRVDCTNPDASKFAPAMQKSMYDHMGQAASFSASSGIPGIRDDGPSQLNRGQYFGGQGSVEPSRGPSVQIPPPNAKVSFCDSPSASVRGNLFPVVNRSVNEAKVSLAQRLASVLVKVGMIDVPAPLLQEMLMKIGAFSSSPPQDITEAEIVSILKRLGYL